MPNVILTGGPGVGKTTVLAELAARGHATVAESARAVIAERRAAGLSPRPAPLEYAREVLRRDIAAYLRDRRPAGWRFFDRGPIDALGSLSEAGGLSEARLQRWLGRLRFHPIVFILPPWQAIYTTDAERDHSYAHAVRVDASLRAWYLRCGFELREVPRLPAAARAEHILATLQRDG